MHQVNWWGNQCGLRVSRLPTPFQPWALWAGAAERNCLRRQSQLLLTHGGRKTACLKSSRVSPNRLSACLLYSVSWPTTRLTHTAPFNPVFLLISITQAGHTQELFPWRGRVTPFLPVSWAITPALPGAQPLLPLASTLLSLSLRGFTKYLCCLEKQVLLISAWDFVLESDSLPQLPFLPYQSYS